MRALLSATLLCVTFAMAGHAEEAQSLNTTNGPPDRQVLTGIDVLAKQGFAPLSGLRLGLLTNKAGKTREGRRTVDVLAKAEGVKLVALFSPEHGLGADREGEIGGTFDSATGLPIHSLYGQTKRPTPEMLQGLDAIAIDLQDVGVRFYTYATTMAYVMEEAAKAKIKVVVLDRPNPIGGAGTSGPVLDKDLISFVGYFPMPVTHGLTLGELARFFNGEGHIGADLQVIAMEGYRSQSWFADTGLAWESPSPNLKRLTGTLLYPGIGMLEFANLSVGRGTPAPFEVVGAPWIDAAALARELTRAQVPGVRVRPTTFVPKSSKFKGQTCQGVALTVLSRDRFDALRLGLEIAVALRRLHPEAFEHRDLLKLLGSRETLAAIEAGKAPSAIAASWQAGIAMFKARAAPYTLY